ncbi:hypothetical protein FB192DRAFT_1375718 [Mucor lusitanicus]|uniref:Uncharacterized protein n=1 Tax=Mucor circinelloides f. lusitanicus TaxID=29924 RepID=A0A8H4BGP7_MUCCL|nr:hypothetical protein FB192DRAFT_1375718 [Mucor lusitanicus]
MLIKHINFLIVLLCCWCCGITNLLLLVSADDTGSISKSTTISTTSETVYEMLPEDYNKDAIYRHIVSVLMKRASKQTVPVTPELSTMIVAQIKARIHTQITTKISASVFQKVKASITIKTSIMGGAVHVGNAQIEAIQTAAVDGLKTQMTKTVEKEIEESLSESITPAIDQLLVTPGIKNQKALSTKQLTNVLIKAETIARTELKIKLPTIQKTLKSCVDKQLNAHIKDLQVDIPGVLKIQISANVDVISSVKTAVQKMYKSYADVSVAVAVQSYIKGITASTSKSSLAKATT